MRALVLAVSILALSGCTASGGDVAAPTAGVTTVASETSAERVDRQVDAGTWALVSLTSPTSEAAYSVDVSISPPASESYLTVVVYSVDGPKLRWEAASLGTLGPDEPIRFDIDGGMRLVVAFVDVQEPTAVSVSVVAREPIPISELSLARANASALLVRPGPNGLSTNESLVNLEVQRTGSAGAAPVWAERAQIRSFQGGPGPQLSYASLVVFPAGGAGHTDIAFRAFGEEQRVQRVHLRPAQLGFFLDARSGVGDSELVVERVAVEAAPRLAIDHLTMAFDASAYGWTLEPIPSSAPILDGSILRSPR